MSVPGQLSFANDLWDSFETVCARLKSGSAFCKAYMKFWAEYSKETKEYAKKLKEITKTAQEDTGSMNLGWMAVKQDIESLANVYNRIADDVGYKVIQPVENHLKETSRVKRKGKESGRKLIESICESVKTISLAKVEYEKAMRIHDQSKTDFDRASNFNELSNSSKMKKKMDTDRKKAESMERKYRRAIEKGKILENRLFDSEMPEILTEFEQIDRKRLTTVKNSIDSFRKSHLESIASVEAICKKMGATIDNISPDGDVNDFIAEKKTGKDKNSQRIEFEPFSSQYKCCVKEGSVPSLPPSTSSSSLSSFSSANSFDNNAPTLQRSQTMISSTNPLMTRQSDPKLTSSSFSALDVHSTNNNNPNPLVHSHSQPQGIQVLPKQAQPQQVQQQVVHQQQQTSVGGLDPRLSKSMSGVPVKEIGYCKALFDYEGSQPSELSFKKNDIITIYEKDASGWWVGEVRGKMGFFPSVDWVEELPNQSLSPIPTPIQTPIPTPVQTPAPTPAVTQPGKRICKALFPMTAINPNELNLHEGDILTIEGEAEGWYFGTNQMGQSGMFPASFVSIVN